MSDRSVPDQVDIKHKWILSCRSSSSYYWSAANFVPTTLKIYDLFWHQIRPGTGNITAKFRRKPHQLARLCLSSSPRTVTDSKYCRNWMASYNVLYVQSVEASTHVPGRSCGYARLGKSKNSPGTPSRKQCDYISDSSCAARNPKKARVFIRVQAANILPAYAKTSPAGAWWYWLIPLSITRVLVTSLV